MNWDYITGFFDADGSITLSKHHNAPYKTVQVYFHNNELALLEEIRDFIEKETGIKGVILTKKPAKIEHRTAYDLRYIYFRTANRILKNMPSKHPKKRHRISISFELEKLTPRNGKYTEVTLARRLEKEKEFFAH